MTQSAAGGSGNVAGVRHEGRSLAWMAAHMLVEKALPDWAPAGLITAVGAQTSRAVDDIGALTDADGWICAQAKKNLSRSDRPTSDLASALAQLIELKSDGIPDRPPHQDTMRALDAERDRVLILTDERAPRTVAVSLADVTDRLRTLPEGVPLGEVAENRGEREALATLHGHLERLLAAKHGRPSSEAEVRAVLRLLAVRAVDLREDGRDLQALLPDLRDLLEDPARVPDLWRSIEAIAQRLASERRWMRRTDLVSELESRGFYLRPLTRLRPDIQRLRDVSASNLQSPPTNLAVTTPNGPIELPRPEVALLETATSNVAITGEPGAGKSVVLHRLANFLAFDIVYLTSHQLRGSAGETRTEIVLQHGLEEVLRGWTGSSPGVLLLDGLDQTRGLDTSTWLPLLARRLEGTRWRIVGSVRSFDLRQGRDWQSMFAGTPIDTSRADPLLSQVSHLVVGALTSTDVAVIRESSPAMDTMFARNGDRLRGLLTNPFNLNLVGELLSANVDISAVRSRLDLLHSYWRLRVSGRHDGRMRHRVLQHLVRAMVAEKVQQVDDSHLQDSSLQVLSDLLRDGVLRETAPNQWIVTPAIGFTHPVLFDYAAAIIALGDIDHADSLADALDAHPDYALLLRPSLDYRLAIAWHADPNRSTYWQLALRLSSRAAGHTLAAAASAALAAQVLQQSSDLNELQSACTADQDAERWTVNDARALAFLVAAGLRSTKSTQVALDAFGQFLAALGTHAQATDDVALALLAAQLSTRAVDEQGLDRDSASARYWVDTSVACMKVALVDPESVERFELAERAALGLSTAAKLDAAATAATIRQVIAEPALRAWGTEAVRPLIEALPAIAKQDVELAAEIGRSVWIFDDDQDQPTQIGNSQILRLTSNRKQDLEGARHQVGGKFPALAAEDVTVAAALFVTVVEHRSAERRPSVEPPSGQQPAVQYSGDLRFVGGHHALPAMANALIDRFEALAPDGGEAIEVLRSRLTHSEVWNRLLQRAASSPSSELAVALVPVLSSPSLFAHPQTWLAAAHVARRLATVLSAEDLAPIDQSIIAATEPNQDDTDVRRERLRDRRALILNELAAARSENPADSVLAPILLDEDGSYRVTPDSETSDLTPRQDLLRRAHEALSSVRQAGDRTSARRLILDLWPELRAAHEAESTDQNLHVQLVSAAFELAALPDVLPNTMIGEQVFTVVQAAVPSAPEDQDRAAGSATENDEGWLQTAQTEALPAAQRLLARREWRDAHGEQLRSWLISQLDSDIFEHRVLSNQAIATIWPSPDDRIRAVEQRLANEHQSHIARLLLNQLYWLISTHPHEVDAAFERLAISSPAHCCAELSGTRSEIYNTPAEDLGRSLTTLAVRVQTPFADRMLREWIQSPTTYAGMVAAICSWLRGFLNSADLSLGGAQQRAFALLDRAADGLLAAWTAGTDSQAALEVANAIAEQIYHASGAFEAGEPTKEALGDPGLFADLAIPVLEKVRLARHPAVTHHIVETAAHFANVRPRPALLLAMRAIVDDSHYAAESLGLNAALKLIERYAADHRDLILGDPDCTSAVRRVLEHFVRVGWAQAVELVERADEWFR
ncbi:hypothetical protein [Cryptosporangium sp. NPDC051539]|uniref:hypothetical protein n=1 Tax=Cryptosporangium sp. NPDC051539 TaxID=3363962 RepID=UPI0037A92774